MTPNAFLLTNASTSARDLMATRAHKQIQSQDQKMSRYPFLNYKICPRAHWRKSRETANIAKRSTTQSLQAISPHPKKKNISTISTLNWDLHLLSPQRLRHYHSSL